MLNSFKDGYQHLWGMCWLHLHVPKWKQSLHKINTQNIFQWKLSMTYRTPGTYPRDHTSNLMLCLLKTRWQARELRWIVSLKVALYAGLFVSFINEVRSLGGSSCKRHIMIGKTATRLTFLGHIMKAKPKVMSTVELWTNVRQYRNVQYMTTSFICCGTLKWKSHCLPPSCGNISV